jgi:hypothetical protein
MSDSVYSFTITIKNSKTLDKKPKINQNPSKTGVRQLNNSVNKNLYFRSHSKLCHKEEHVSIISCGSTDNQGVIPHDHDFCQQISINVS